jgi:AP-4 complex subunit epsilon-1
MSASPQVRDFFELVKAIGESKSKQEEDRIVADEVIYLKKVVPLSGNTKKKMKELVVRAIYVEMLGQDASFAYIKAVELCASTTISQKRIGYLAAALCLSPDHEFRFMLVNQIQRDMKSTNVLESCAALSAVCKIVTEDMIPAVIGEVIKLLKHDMEAVRKRAVSAIHRLYQMDKRCIVDQVDKIRRALCDKEPSVMAATLPLFQDMIQDDVMQFKDLVPSFVSILKQITEHRLPREYDYHRIPSPWIQMNLLRILALLGRGDQASSEGMYEVLVDVMKRADTGINVGYAIVYEVVKTVTTIYPNTLLLDAAATSISRFIRSDSHNLKYIGIKGLASIVKDHPRYAADHQMAVIDCLEDPDETLKRKTLDLLFRMTNAVNVEFIVDKLLSFLSGAMDDHFRTDLVGQITQCAERFAPSNAWYVQTVIKVFELAGDKVKVSVAQTLTQLIAEGAEQDDDDEDEEDGNKDDELRSEAVEHFLELMDKAKLPEILAQAMAWVLGEYGYLSVSCSKQVIMERLCDLATQSDDSETRAQIVTALMKLTAQEGACPPRIVHFITQFTQSASLDVQQRCIEFMALLRNSSTMVDVLPSDASCEDIAVDENLSFLNSFVQNALNLGAAPYSPPEDFDDNDDEEDFKKSQLKITPYALPSVPQQPQAAIMQTLPSVNAGPVGPTPLGPALNNQQGPNLSIASSQGNQLINTRGVSQVWGKKPEPPPPAPIPQVEVQSSVVTPTKTDNYGLQQNQYQQQQQHQQQQNTFNQPVTPEPVIPAGPKVLTEKEKMAAALFGGVSNGNKATAASKRRTSQQTTSAPVPAYASPEQPAAPLISTPSHAPVPAPAPAAVSHSLLDMDLLSMPATPAYLSPQVQQQQFNQFPPTPPPAFNNPAPISPAHSAMGGMASSAISDVFGDMNLTAHSAPVDSGVRPLVITTAEFGKRWGGAPFDAKQSVHCNFQNLEQLRVSMPASFHHVESIHTTSEAIFAATATSVGSVILVHVKLHVMKRACDVVVKSSSHEISNRELAVIAHSISTAR